MTATTVFHRDDDTSGDEDPAARFDEVPEGVVDRLLWRDAQYVLARHVQDDDRCGQCGAAWPCTATRLAQRADTAARLPWRDGWTTRHDLNGMLTLPEWRAAKPPAGRRPGPH